MEHWRETTRLPLLLDALGLLEEDPRVQRLTAAFGGEPVAVSERLVGEPARRSRRLHFASGGGIILHDGVVKAVLLDFVRTPPAPHALALSEWIDAVDDDATLGDLKDAIGAPRRFAGLREPYFDLGDGYARLDFAEGGWNAPGNLRRVVVTRAQPGLACRPEDDDCPTCSDLLVRTEDPAGEVDVDATVDSLTAALAAGALTEDAHWVRLNDLRPLHESGLLDRVESQLTCVSCQRIVCFALIRGSSATLGYDAMNDAMQHRLEVIPPVELWGDATRIAQEREGMRYVDHRPGAWFLVEQQDTFYLEARYSYSAVIDDSVLIRLDDAELAAYRDGGGEYLSELATRIHHSAPYRDSSPYKQRDLYRGPDRTSYRAAVSAATVNHTWIAQQRRAR